MTSRALLLMLLLSLALMSRSEGASVALLGFVVAADSHQPLEGAHVLIEAGGQQQTGTTDARGAFVFDRVKSGEATLVVRHPGFGEQRQQVEVRSPGPTSVVVSMRPSTAPHAGGSDVFVALVTPAASTSPPPDTVLHLLAALAHNYDPIQSGLKLQQQSGTPVTPWPNALMRLGGGATEHVDYWRLPTAVYWIAATPDGRHLLAATDSSSIEVFTLADKPVVERVLALNPPAIVTSLHATHQGAYATVVNAAGVSAVVALAPNGERVRGTWTLAGETVSASDLAISPDGRRLYVTAFARRGLRGPGRARVYVLDAASGAVVGTVDTPPEPIGAALTPDGRRLLVTSLSAAAVTIVDTETLQVVKRIQVGLRPTRVAVAADGRSAYVSCSGDDRVYVLDLASQSVRTTIDVDKNPLAVQVSGNRVLVGCSTARTVCVIEGDRVVSRSSPQASAAPFGICERR